MIGGKTPPQRSGERPHLCRSQGNLLGEGMGQPKKNTEVRGVLGQHVMCSSSSCHMCSEKMDTI